MDIDHIYCILKEKHKFSFDLKKEQTACLRHIVDGKHVFGLLPTGYGKSMCFVLAPLIIQEITGLPKTALVVSPLRALMLDQMKTLLQHNIKTAAIMKDMPAESVRDIKDGKVQVLFASPECIVQKEWLRLIAENPLCDQICALVFDEAHCISEWGLDFREEYRRVSEIVSVLDETPTMLLTATATKKIQDDLVSLLALPPTTEIVARVPDRPNIYLHVEKAVENHETNLIWIVEHLASHGLTSKKILVYCQTLRACETLYIWAMQQLGDNAFLSKKHTVSSRLLDMYHSRVDHNTINRVLNEFPKPDSHIRLLFSTIAFGMGVQINDIDIIINWGLGSSALSFWQEVGRCARDGRDGLSITYAFKRSINVCKDQKMKEIVESEDCIRLIMLDQFLLRGMEGCLEDMKTKTPCNLECDKCKCSYCKCCMNCQKKCKCGGQYASYIHRTYHD